MAGGGDGVVGAGAGRWGGPDVLVATWPWGRVMAPLGGLPPTGGWWWLYQTFSPHRTIPPPPWPRAHSVNRALIDVPSPGLVSAPAREIPVTTMKIESRATTTRKTRRLQV